jgi:hypothetical protein
VPATIKPNGQVLHSCPPTHAPTCPGYQWHMHTHTKADRQEEINGARGRVCACICRFSVFVTWCRWRMLCLRRCSISSSGEGSLLVCVCLGEYVCWLECSERAVCV